MFKAQGIASLVLAFFLAGCASSSQHQTDLANLNSNSVPPVTVAKVDYNQPLDLSDIVALAQHKVSDDFTLRYLKYRRTIYRLSQADVDQLLKDGVSQGVISYLLSTPTLYAMDRQRQEQINQSTTPVRDPLLNGQAIPRSR